MIAPAYMAYILDMGEWGKRDRACEVMKLRGASREVVSIMSAPMPNENAMDEAWDRIYKRRLEGVRERWREHDLRVDAKVAKQLEYERVQWVKREQQAKERDRLRKIEEDRVAEERIANAALMARVKAEAEVEAEKRRQHAEYNLRKKIAAQKCFADARERQEQINHDQRARRVYGGALGKEQNASRAEWLMDAYKRSGRHIAMDESELVNAYGAWRPPDTCGMPGPVGAHLLDCPIDPNEIDGYDDRRDPEWESFCSMPVTELLRLHIAPAWGRRRDYQIDA